MIIILSFLLEFFINFFITDNLLFRKSIATIIEFFSLVWIFFSIVKLSEVYIKRKFYRILLFLIFSFGIILNFLGLFYLLI
jgi:hypothetical protein